MLLCLELSKGLPKEKDHFQKADVFSNFLLFFNKPTFAHIFQKTRKFLPTEIPCFCVWNFQKVCLKKKIISKRLMFFQIFFSFLINQLLPTSFKKLENSSQPKSHAFVFGTFKRFA